MSCGIAVADRAVRRPRVAGPRVARLAARRPRSSLSAAWSVNSPAWLAILPALVPRAELPGAIAANGVAYNLSRTVGPDARRLRHRPATASPRRTGRSRPPTSSWSRRSLWWRAPPKETASLPAERLTRRDPDRHQARREQPPFPRDARADARGLSVRRGLFRAHAADRARPRARAPSIYGVLLSMISAGALVSSFAQRFLPPVRRPRLDGRARIGRHRGRARPLRREHHASRPARRRLLRRRRLGRWC